MSTHLFRMRAGGASLFACSCFFFFFKQKTAYEMHDALEALTASEGRFRTLAEALPQLVWTSQPDGQRDYFSRQWVEYTGVPEEDQLGLAWLDKVVHPEHRERVREGWVAAVQGQSDYDLELRI